MVGVVVIVAILIIVPERPPVALVRVHGDRQQLGLRRRNDLVRARVLLVLGSGMLMAQYTITGFDASAHTAEETNNASRMAATGHVDFGRRLGDLRLDPPRRRHVRDPEHAGGPRHGQCPRAPRALDLAGVDGPGLGRGAALHLRRRAVLLRDRVRDLGLADDVRLLAGPRGAGAPALAERREEPRAAVVGASASALRGAS